jgi:archaellin
MYWLLDESKSFIYQTTPTKNWNIAVVAGAALPYKGRHKWIKIGRRLRHGSEYKPQDLKEICSILDDMIQCGIEAVVVIGDVGHASLAHAEKLRSDLIDPLYSFADLEPSPRREAVRSNLDNLMGLGTHKLSLQEFFKVWSMLEVIVALMQLYMLNLGKMRSIDLRPLKVIIDDQAKASLMTFQEFLYLFIYARSKDGRFSCPPGTINRLNGYNLRIVNGVTCFNATALLNQILVEEHGSKMDDKYPELKIVDLIANFFRRTLQGELPYTVAEKLNKIVKIKVPLQATPKDELVVQVPSQAQSAVGLLLPN